MYTEAQFLHTYESSQRIVSAGGIGFDTSVGVDVWYDAKTLLEFGEATALWLEGNIGSMPTAAYYSHPNNESMPLLPYINPLNRALVSNFSQPACTAALRPLGGIMDE